MKAFYFTHSLLMIHISFPERKKNFIFKTAGIPLRKLIYLNINFAQEGTVELKSHRFGCQGILGSNPSSPLAVMTFYRLSTPIWPLFLHQQKADKTTFFQDYDRNLCCQYASTQSRCSVYDFNMNYSNTG